jgi:hypothetical protein
MLYTNCYGSILFVNELVQRCCNYDIQMLSLPSVGTIAWIENKIWSPLLDTRAY